MQAKAKERMDMDGLGCPKMEEEQARLALGWWRVRLERGSASG